LSQAYEHLFSERVSHFIDSDGAVNGGDGPNSFQGNVIVGDRVTERLETPMTETIDAYRINSGLIDSYEDDWQNHIRDGGGYTATEKGL